MDSPMKQAAKFLRDKQGGRRRLAVFLCLALLVTAGTVTAFALHGQTSQHTQRVLQCAYAVHQHSEDCYPGGDTNAAPVCGLADFVVHTHNEDCYPGGDMTAAPVCGLAEIEAHTHGDDCYAAPLVCGLEETGPHTHTAACYSEEDRTVADGHPEIEAVEGHVHGEACYAPAELTCGQEERPAVAAVEADPGHTHTDECYTETSALTCGQDGVEGHEHTDECYTVSRELTCGQEERPAVDAVAGDEGHTHTEGCYAAPVLTCELEEIEPVEGHVHTEECYTIAEGAEPACGIEETEGHTHSEECYGEPELTCEKAEIELHTHSEEEGCYAPLTEEEKQLDPVPEHGALICDKLQIEEHTHGEECFIEEVLTPEEVADLESEAQQPGVVDLDPLTYADGQIQVTVRYDSASLLPEGVGIALIDAGTPEPALDISQQAAPAPEETEEPAGPDSAPASLPAVDASSAPEAEGEPAPLAEPVPEGEPAPAATPAEGEIDPAPAEPIEPAEPAPADPAEPAAPVEGETGSETDAPALVRAGFVDAEGREWRPAATVIYTVEYLLDGAVAASADYEYTPGGTLPTFPCALATFEQTVETDSFKVTARYTELAGLGDAELRASSITDPEQVAEYEAAYRQAVSSEQARMLGLLDIGFWNGDAEVQPAVPVAITVQLLGEDGLPAGEPVKVVHFGDETEHFDAKVDEQGVASFNLRSFSPVAIGQVPETDEEGRASLVGKTFEWVDPQGLYHVTFEITGVISPKAEEPATPEKSEEPAAPQAPSEEAAAGEPEDDEEPADPADPEEKEPENNEEPQAPTEDEAEAGEPEVDTTNIPVATDALLEFKVDLLDESDEVFALYQQAAESDVNKMMDLAVLRYGLIYGGVEMDLSNCDIVMTVTPTMNLQTAAAAYVEANPVDNGDDDGDGYVEAALGDGLLPAPSDRADILLDLIVPAANAEQPVVSQGTILLDGANAVMADSPVMQPAPALAPAGTVPDADATMPGVPGEEQPETMTLALSDQQLTSRVQNAGMAMFSARAANTAAISSGTELDPRYTVQFYANLRVPSQDKASGSNRLEVIDTSGLGSPNTRLTLLNQMNPTRKETGGFRYLCLTDKGQVQYDVQLTEVYTSETYRYSRKPGIVYVNKLIENNSYKPVEIWVLKKGKDSSSIKPADWTSYPFNGDMASVHFTNRVIPESEKPNGHTFILIEENAVVRFVYDVGEFDRNIGTLFYDYDITGMVGKERKTNSYLLNIGAQEWTGGGNLPKIEAALAKDKIRLALEDGAQGINSSSNYTYPDSDHSQYRRLAFGNANTGAGLGLGYYWNGNLLNAGNSAANKDSTNGLKPGSYMACTFGLVDHLQINADGYSIQYSDGVIAPKLFNEPNQGTVVGKRHVNQIQSLQFKQYGDTYTLFAVNGSSTQVKEGQLGTLTGLDSFYHPGKYNGTNGNKSIWTNNFWPIDGYPGADGRTLSGPIVGAYGGTTYPGSDDGISRNTQFGMHFTVNFDLDKDYIGPLDYWFFGDDDMWVFLQEGDANTGTLVCDIGGVHSSAGEYVNLWDYIPGGRDRHETESYTLYFYYTERGLSGSTCWMQFTLPSVTSGDPTDRPGQSGALRIDKEVQKQVNGENVAAGVTSDNGEEYAFLINLASNGITNYNSYRCAKYKTEELEKELAKPEAQRDLDSISIANDLIVFDNGVFTLHEDESIYIQYLPIGTTYKITELSKVYDAKTKSLVDSNYDYQTTVAGNAGQGTATHPEGTVVNISLDGKLVAYTYTGKETVATGTIQAGATAEKPVCKVAFTNTYNVFQLPKTGGVPGIVFVSGGAMLVMLAAAVYAQRKRRKKAEETPAK